MQCRGFFLPLQRHLSALTKFAHVESRFYGRKQQGKAASDTPINPCVWGIGSTSVAVGLLAVVLCGATPAFAQSARDLQADRMADTLWWIIDITKEYQPEFQAHPARPAG